LQVVKFEVFMVVEYQNCSLLVCYAI